MFQHPIVHVADQLMRATTRPETETEMFERLAADERRVRRAGGAGRLRHGGARTVAPGSRRVVA